jgi:hypothetical protein
MLPWLEGALAAAFEAGATPRLPDGEYLASRGDSVRSDKPWRAWLLDALGVGGAGLERASAGPCARALLAEPPTGATFACARPVHLLTAIDHLQLGRASVDLDAAETAAILADLNRHLDGRGFGLQPVGIGRDWLLTCRDLLDCTSVEPEQAEGQNLRDTMPGGRDGATVRALMNEIQMLLHEHPVNEARAARREPVVNSLWLWGFGAKCETIPAAWPRLCSDDSWLAGLWRAHGQPACALEEFAGVSDAGISGTVFAWSGASAGALDEAESLCFAPARRLLEAGACRSVALRSERHVTTTGRAARYLFWRRARPLRAVLCE